MRMFTRTLIIADVRQVLFSNASQTNVRRQCVSALYAVNGLTASDLASSPISTIESTQR